LRAVSCMVRDISQAYTALAPAAEANILQRKERTKSSVNMVSMGVAMETDSIL
jgi:tRNA uridine 5-carbamoylmethylation protein Kti12